MKKNLTRILCSVLCAAFAFTGTVFATEADSSESIEKTAVQTPAEEKKGLRYDKDAVHPVFAGYTPDYSGYGSYEYDLFLDILKLYSDTHLFEFTEEQAKEAFLMKLMQENPELMALFIDTLLTTMDPFSGYYEAGYGLASDGSSAGYGIVMGDETNGNIISMGRTTPGLYITDVVKNSNADKAGLRTGDRIVSVEGVSLDGLTFNGASYLLRYLPYIPKEEFDEMGNSLGIPNEPEFVITDEKTGKKSYYIHLEVERNGEIIPTKMIKGRVIYPNITYERAPDKSYSKITVSSFAGDNDIADFAAAVEIAKKESNGNLLIDLRDNTGGRLESALEMANMLIEEKDRIICYYNSREHDSPEVVLSNGTGYSFEKITILVNEYTASASELLAMTLRYNCGATLIGTTTYGKGVGQQVYSFSTGDMFAITTLEILDPLKRSYHTTGLVPDVEIGLCMDKYKFPEGVTEFLFVPNSTMPNTSADAAEGDMLPCMTFTQGEESENILALEKRFEILGFLRPGEADGKFDNATLSAIKSYELYINNSPDGTIDEREARLINSMSEKYKNYYFSYDSQFEVAEMSFKSVSQAKRRAKELLTQSTKVEKDYEAYLKAEEERIKAEEKAEAEAEAKAEAEAEAGEIE